MTDPRLETALSDDPPPVLRFTPVARLSPDPALPAETEATAAGPDGLDQRLREIETRIEKLAERFDQLEFVIVEQFEPGMTAAGELPGGNLRERLDRIEGVLGLLSQAPEELPAAETALEAEPSGLAAQLDAVASRLSEMMAAQGLATDRAEARLDGLVQAFDALSGRLGDRHDELVGVVERAVTRQPPVPDLALQHRSFAGFATALQMTLRRVDDAVSTILAGVEAVAERVAALEARPAASTAAGAPASGDLDASLGALCDRIGALTAALADAAEQRGAGDIAALSMRLDALGAVMSASLEDSLLGNRTVIEDTLRDLRLAVAEIAAENHRLRIA